MNNIDISFTEIIRGPFSLLFCKSGRDIIVISDYGGRKWRRLRKARGLVQSYSSSTYLNPCLENRSSDPSRRTLSIPASSFCVSHGIFQTFPYSSGFFLQGHSCCQSIPSCKWPEVGAASDETCPGRHRFIVCSSHYAWKNGFWSALSQTCYVRMVRLFSLSSPGFLI